LAVDFSTTKRNIDATVVITVPVTIAAPLSMGLKGKGQKDSKNHFSEEESQEKSMR
jgi:hypothetical protein